MGVLCVAAGIADSWLERRVIYLQSYGNNIKKLEDEVKKLEEARGRIKHLVDAEERNGYEILVGVRDWLILAEQVIDEANHVLEDPNHAKLGFSMCSFPNLRHRHRVSKEAFYTIGRVAYVLESGKFDRVGYYIPKALIKLESRELLKNSIMETLRDPKVRKVGVWGLAGVGKTTLLNQLAQQLERQRLFDAIIMLSLSQTPDLTTIQAEIAKILGMHLQGDIMSLADRARQLCSRMKMEKNILIIMDHIWAPLDLEMLGIPSLDHHVGCKQLLISRNRDVLLQMGTQQDFRVQVLNEQEMWRFFPDIGGEEVEHAILLRNIAKIAKEYAGLPDLASRVALALRNKDIVSCKYALNQLEQLNRKQKNEIICSALELSYNQLKSDQAKSLFLLCGALGTSSFLSDLLKFGIGLAIFEDMTTVKDARKELYKMVSALKQDCLLLEENNKSDQVKMHHIVYQVAILIAARDKLMFTIKSGAELKEWPPEDFFKRCTQIIIHDCYIQKLPERLDCPELKLFYLNSAKNRDLEMPDSFFNGMGGLQVLCLISMSLSSLPTSLCSLFKLKSMCLNQCVLKDISGIGALENLEILSLTNSSFEFSYELGQLTGLRMLDLSHSRIELIPPKIVSKWSHLEEVYTGNTFINWGLQDSSIQNKNCSLAELKLLPNLTTLDIKINPHTGAMPRDLLSMLEMLDKFRIVVGDELECGEMKHGFSKRLELQLGSSIDLEKWIKEVVKRVDDLWLGEIKGISNVVHQLNGEGLPLLKHLHIQNNATIRHIVNSVDISEAIASFPKLETMVLHNLNYLYDIFNGPLSFDSFSNLRVIKVQRCNKLQRLITLSIYQILYNLEEMEVSECNSLKEIVDVRSNQIWFPKLQSLTLQHLPALLGFSFDKPTSPQTQQRPLFDSCLLFSNLKTVKLSSLKLKQIFNEDDSSLNPTSELSSFIVEDCIDLKYVFPSNTVTNLIKLNRLEISKCHMMEQLIMPTNEGVDYTEVAFPDLKILKLSSMSVKNIWDKKGQLSGASLRNLTNLIVGNCDDLTFLFSSSMVGSLSKLNRLEISKCHKMEQILRTTDEGKNNTQALFPFLETIIICDMQNLETVWQLHQPPPLNSLNRLRRMEVKNCDKLVNIFSIKIPRIANSAITAEAEISHRI